MRILATVGLLAAMPAFAQSPLTTLLGGTNQAGQGSQLFFDLVTTTTVTIQALDMNLSSAPGVTGTIEVYLTNPGVTTYLGNTSTPAQWSAAPVATGQIVAAGANQYSYVCLSPGIVLPPGGRGVALRHVDCQPWYTNTPVTSFSTAEMTLTGGAVQGVPWGALTQPRLWNGRIHYAIGAGPHACASNVKYGPGCYQQQTSFYQFFSDAPSAAAALSGRAISVLKTATGYTVVQSPGHPWVTPTASAAVFVADDAEYAWSWPSATPFGGPGGQTTLYVHSNGIISLSPQSGLTPSSYRPNVPAMLNAGATAWWSWHDYVATQAGSGPIKMEEIAGVLYITWDGVESYAAAVNPSWLQFQCVLATGDVHIVWQSITPIGTSLYGDSHVIGFSPGGPSMDPGPTDLTTFAAIDLGPIDVPPLTLTTAPRPALGSTVTWSTTNATSAGLGVHFLSVSDLPPFSPGGLDLAGLGAPGCVANVDIGQGISNVISNLGAPFPGMDVSLTLPVDLGLLGASIYGQSVWLDPAANAGGMLTSNAVRSILGTF